LALSVLDQFGLDHPPVRELKAQGMRPVDIAKVFKIGRASVYRVLGQAST
jgi:DNA invertase Pin-like site-specific DNA recombinase